MKHRPIHANSWKMAIFGARRLPDAAVDGQMDLLRQHLTILLSGQPAAALSWRSMVDAASVAEELARLRIGSGDEADGVINQAKAMLQYMHQWAAERGTWALHAKDRQSCEDALAWLLTLHDTQMRACSHREYSLALDRAEARAKAALRGQHGKGVTVVGGT